MKPKALDIDIDVLHRCQSLQDRHGACGIFPRGAQHRQFKRMEREGLLKFVDWGVDIDGDDDKERPIYEITMAGRLLLKDLGS